MTIPRSVWLSSVLALGLSWTSTEVHAQSVPVITLGGTVGRLSDGFSWINAVRELPDGRVLLSLTQDPHLVVADYRTRMFEQIGSVGSGPGEYRTVGRIQALGGDSTLVPGGEGRWLIFSGTTPVQTIRTWSRGRFGMAPVIQGADRTGRVLEVTATKYGKQAGVMLIEYNQNAESLAVIVHRRTGPGATEAVAGRPDTLARIRGSFREVRHLTRGSYGGTGVRYTLYTILDGPEQAVMFLDGSVAVVYAEPYHVEWHATDRRRTVGSPLPFERVPVDEAQKLAAVARDWPLSPTLFKPDEYPPWPNVLPPFQDKALVAMSDGRLAIQRTPDPRVKFIYYDLVDRSGRLTAKLQLKENEKLFCISERWAYVARRDRDDLIWLERYAWPPA